MPLPDFINATIEALYFTDTGDEDQPDANAELSADCRTRLEADCTSFWYRTWYYFEPAGITDEKAGHYFWLTRNWHGAGFWDGDIPEPYARTLTDISRGYGLFETEIDDNGKISAP